MAGTCKHGYEPSASMKCGEGLCSTKSVSYNSC